MRSINGYIILPLQYPPVVDKSIRIRDEEGLKSNEIQTSDKSEGKVVRPPLSAIHQLLMKEHHDHANPQNKGKVLFIGNVDYFLSISYEQIQQYLTLLFQSFGEIESISISEADDIESPTRFAHITFQKKSSVKYILKSMKEEEWKELFDRDVAPYLNSIRPKNIVGDGSHQTLIGNLIDSYRWKTVDEEQVQEEVNAFMAEYDQQEMRELLERKEMKNQPDEDGFITVVSRYSITHFYILYPRVDCFTVLTLRSKRKMEQSQGSDDSKNKAKKKKTGELKNFYAFQKKEEKMKQLDLLRQRIEENKERLQKMKAQRKFNPFG